MIDSNELKISITGTLDKNATVNEINAAIKKIKTDLDKIDIKFNIDDSMKKTLLDFTKSMERFKEATADYNQILREEKVVVQELNGITKEKIRQELKSGAIKETEITRINNKIKKVKEEQIETKKLISDYEKLGQVQKKIQRQNAEGKTTNQGLKVKDGYNDINVKADAKGNVTSVTNTQNVEKERKATEDLVNSKSKLNKQLQLLESQGKINSKTFEKMSNSINVSSDIAQLKKLENTMKVLERSFNRKKNQGELLGSSDKLKDLTRATNEHLVSALKSNNVIKDQEVLAAKLNRATGQWSATIKTSAKEQTTLSGYINSSNGAIYRQSEAVRDLTARHQGFGQQLGIALQRTVTWASAMTGIYGTIRGFQNMLQEVLLIDKAMTELKRVFDATPQQYNSMLEQSIEMSRELGNNVHDVLQSLNEVARSYGDRMTEQEMLAVTKTSMLAANVSDLTAEEAMKNLIGTMNAYKISANETIKIVDKMNEVD